MLNEFSYKSLYKRWFHHVTKEKLYFDPDPMMMADPYVLLNYKCLSLSENSPIHHLDNSNDKFTILFDIGVGGVGGVGRNFSEFS